MAACASPIDVIIGSQLTNDAMAQAEPTESNVADLRNERNFPTFANCPEREVDLKFFDVIDDEILKPKYHWCLLAEVTQVNLTKESDVVILRDKAGHRLPMLLSIPDKCYDLKDISEEAENLKHRFRAGKCVVILYPIRHNFLSGDVGIRLAIESWAKVIPCYSCSLEKFLGLSDRVKAQNSVVDGRKACQACGKRAGALVNCKGCKLSWYCDEVCQQVGWNQKGHKDDCMILKDRDIQGMFMTNWSVYDSSLCFPFSQNVETS